ncbi:MAG TPA: hypothetical protein VK841_00225 [Polyangiaceae bacterium]|nr:hypothetical protein [Polyangiaceae bacterium]
MTVIGADYATGDIGTTVSLAFAASPARLWAREALPSCRARPLVRFAAALSPGDGLISS